jgi:hypothetical protein
MAEITYTVATHGNDAFTLGVKYDSETLLITHVGGESNHSRAGSVEIEEPITGITRERTIPIGTGRWLNIRGLGLYVVPDGDGIRLPVIFRTFSSRSSGGG